MANLQKLGVLITAKNDTGAAVGKAKKDIVDLGNGVQVTTKDIKAMGAAATAAFTAVGFSIAGMVQSYAGHEQRLANLATLYDDNIELTKHYEKETLRMAATSTQGIAQIQTTSYGLNSALGSNKESMDILTQGIMLNDAAQGDLDGTMFGVRKTMNAFKIDVGDLNNMFGALFMGVRQGDMNMSEFGPALGRLGGPATALGLSINEVSAGLAVMTANSGNAQLSTTQLERLFIALIAPTKQMTDQFEKAGYTIEDYEKALAEGGLGGALGFLLDVQTKTGDKMFEWMAQTEAAAATTLTNKGALDQYNTTLDNTYGAYDLMVQEATDVNDTLQAQWTMLNDKLNVIWIVLGGTIGDLILPVLRSLNDALMNVVEWFINLDDTTQKVIGVIMLGTFAIMGIVAAVFAWQVLTLTQTGLLAGMATVAKATWASILGPALPIVLAIGAITAAIVLAYQNVEWFRDIVNNVFNAVMGIVETFVGFVRVWFNIVKNIMLLPFRLLWAGVKWVFSKIGIDIGDFKDFVVGVFSGIVNAIEIAADAIKKFVTKLVDAYNWTVRHADILGVKILGSEIDNPFASSKEESLQRRLAMRGTLAREDKANAYVRGEGEGEGEGEGGESWEDMMARITGGAGGKAGKTKELTDEEKRQKHFEEIEFKKWIKARGQLYAQEDEVGIYLLIQKALQEKGMDASHDNIVRYASVATQAGEKYKRDKQRKEEELERQREKAREKEEKVAEKRTAKEKELINAIESANLDVDVEKFLMSKVAGALDDERKERDLRLRLRDRIEDKNKGNERPIVQNNNYDIKGQDPQEIARQIAQIQTDQLRDITQVRPITT